MEIKYKVVTKERYSAVTPNYGYSKKYRFCYEVGKTIKALKYTLGIMVFNSEENAKRFIKGFQYPLLIIQVEVIGRKKIPTVVKVLE